MFASEEPNRRRSYKNVYPSLSTAVSTASTVFERTEEIAEDNEIDDDMSDTSRRSETNSRNSSKIEDSGDFKLKIIGFLAIFVVLLAIFLFFPTPTKNRVDEKNYEQFFNSTREMIKEMYPAFNKEKKGLIKHIGQKVFRENDASPLVVVFSGRQASKFANDMNKLFQNSQAGVASGSDFSAIDIEENTNRAELHGKLQKTLSDQVTRGLKARSAVVSNVDYLAWDAVLVLHAFADHEKYPIEKTVLFLTISENVDEFNCEGNIIEYLTKKWIENGGSGDNIPPIIARIGYFLCV